jgi:hypothetical protein
MTLGEKTFGEVAADEPGAASDQTIGHEKKPMGVIPDRTVQAGMRIGSVYGNTGRDVIPL